MRYGIRLILGNLVLETKVELTVMSIRTPQAGLGKDRHVAVDLVVPECKSLESKIFKWRMIKNYNDSDEINVWNRYDDISPKCQSLTEKYEPYNIIREFEKTNSSQKLSKLHYGLKMKFRHT